MTALMANTASARTMTPRLARVSSIAAPIGVWTAMPSRPLNRGHKSDFGLAPMLLGDQEDIEIRPHRAAHVGSRKLMASSESG